MISLRLKVVFGELSIKMIYLLVVKGHYYKAVVLLCVAIIWRQSAAQDLGTDFVFDRISKKQGLPDNFINFIFQDSRGFLWLSTNHGLSRYDSYNFKNYTTIGKTGITDLAVKCIAEDKDGNIWFGTESGLNKLNPFTDKIIQYQEGAGPGSIPFRWVNYLYTDKDQNLWLCSEKGLALYYPATNSFQNYVVSVSGKDDRINKFINTVLDDNAGKLWMTTSYGIKAFDKKAKTYTSYHKEEINGQQLKENIFYSLCIDHTGRIWAGTFSGELFIFNKAANVFDKIKDGDVNRNRFAINDIAEIRVGDSWYLLLATTGGLISFDPGSRAGVAVNYSMTGNYLTKILSDRQHNLWVTGSEGLFKLNPNSFAFKWLPIKQKSKETLRIYHIIPDIKNPKTIFYLTTQRGWYKYDAETQTIVQQVLPEDKNLLLKNINGYINDGRGYWFTSVQGFGYFDIYKNRLTNLSRHTFSASGQKTTGSIVKATENKYWITLRRSGILVYDRLTQKDTVIFGNRDYRDNMYGQKIEDMQMGTDGNIWFTGGNKLYRVNPKTYSYKIFTSPLTEEKAAETKIAPYSIYFTQSGRLLICSHLRIYEFKDERLFTVYPLNGYSSFSIEKISEDSKNNLWVQSAEGLYKTDSSFSHWQNMNKLPGWEEGTTLTEINTCRPGEILFASDEKLGLLKTGLLSKNVKPLPVVISRVRAGENENYLVSFQKTVIKSFYKDAVEIELSPVNFIGGEENKMMYRLTGWDKVWKELKTVSVIRYEQLPPGDYTFLTRSVNANGAASPVTLLRFTIIPPFYRTWWFILLAVIIISSGVFMLYRYRLKKALELERLRTRIATDLHDDIGATLSSISLYSQAIKKQLKGENIQLENVLDKMGETSREMVTGMSDIVWAINPENDHGEKLTQRLENYATDMCAAKNIKLQFNADEKLNTVTLPLEHRKNFYLIFKEVINNAVKYSGTETIGVKIELLSKKLVLTIKDEGKGFNEATIIKGNGLKNIYARAREINGVLIIDSAEGRGTAVTLKCTI